MSTSKRVSNGSSAGIAVITNKLDILGRDMKKLKENIQVGCENYGGSQLNTECPLHEKVKSVKEVKYGEFGRPNNNGNGSRYRIEFRDSVNIMPRSMFNHLKLTNLKMTNMLVEMADMTKRDLVGIVENILVKIDKFVFLFDFVIIDMPGNLSEITILGRHFLATIHAQIDVFHGEISLGIRED
nr:hypothetical protein [Tanacetum cinerariifolium]